VSAEPRRRQRGSRSGHEQGEPIAADVDLAGWWVGGTVMAASDESFGEKENLLRPGPAVFYPGHYGNRGEIVDGWETRRRREGDHDWALIRLGTPGIITSVDIDTSNFTGNYPPFCRVEACGLEGYPSPAELSDPSVEWSELVPRAPLQGDAHNTFPVADPHRFTHVRLVTWPDGGVARLRVMGRVVPDPRRFDGLTIDLASQEHGGAVSASSDGFYTSAQHLNRPDRARTMGEGWETRRRRDDGHDLVVFQLALAGRVRQLIVDTAHFRYNASSAIELFGSTLAHGPAADSPAWVPLVPRVSLQPDTRHVFPVTDPGTYASVRLDAFPDGGLSRVRVLGTVDPAARRQAGFHWFDSLPARQAHQVLAGLGLVPAAAQEVIDARPLSGVPVEELRDALEGPPSDRSGDGEL